MTDYSATPIVLQSFKHSLVFSFVIVGAINNNKLGPHIQFVVRLHQREHCIKRNTHRLLLSICSKEEYIFGEVTSERNQRLPTIDTYIPSD